MVRSMMKSILGRHIVLFAVFRVKTKTILQLFQRRYIFLLINSFLKTSIRNFFSFFSWTKIMLDLSCSYNRPSNKYNHATYYSQIVVDASLDTGLRTDRVGWSGRRRVC